jgi:hypothetical protein
VTEAQAAELLEAVTGVLLYVSEVVSELHSIRVDVADIRDWMAEE